MTRILTLCIYRIMLLIHKVAVSICHKRITQGKVRDLSGLLTIQAGSKGLEGVFYEELINSAIETFGNSSVNVDSINRQKSYIKQVINNSKLKKSKYVLLDPRTLHSNPIVGILQACISSQIYLMNSIKPIVILTDASVVKWRLISLIWTCTDGICVMLMEPRQIRDLFPHERTYGPIFVPISARRRARSGQPLPSPRKSEVIKFGFQGTIYPERKIFLEKFQTACESLGVPFCFQDKNSESSNEDYWEFIYDHDVIITTTMQTNLENNFTDHLHVNQLVFRISEVIATGKLLISTPVEGMEKFFKSDEDFIQVNGLEDVINSCKLAISNLDNNDSWIGSHAKDNYESLITNNCFWRILGINEVGECKREICTCRNPN